MNLVACGGGGGSGDDGDDDAPDADPDQPPDADNTGFVELIGRDWEIPNGEEYHCVGIRAPQDMLINTFRTPNPDGEHHTVLTIADDPGGLTGTELGEYECDVNTLDLQMLFASGVGTDDLAFPDGVAMRVEEGQFIHLNLHLFNTQPSGTISGHSAVLVKTITEQEMEHEAEMVFAGTFDIDVPAGEEGMASGGCTFDEPATILAYWPHMHQHATHQKVTMMVGGDPLDLHDQEFDFNEQYNYPIVPSLQVNDGDSINVECSYDNTEGEVDLEWGDSSNKEMCFTGLYRYPKQAAYLFECSTGGPGGRVGAPRRIRP
jgi:hypothetical protein